MGGTREKGPTRLKATPVPITAGGRRPTRSHRPIERFVPEPSCPVASPRSRNTTPSRSVPYSGPRLVIRLKVSPSRNPGTFPHQTQPSNSTATPNTNSIIPQLFLTDSNPSTNFQSFPTTTNSITNVQSFLTTANSTNGLQSSSTALNSIVNIQLSSSTANSTIDLQTNSTTTNFQSSNATTDVQPTQNIASGPLTSFTLFPALPIELRHMIWKFHLPGPRIITVKFDPDGRKHTYRFSATDPLPFLLRVCHESRQVFILRYKQSAFNHPRCLNGCYFNFEQDYLDFAVMSAHGQRTRWIAHANVANDIKHVKNVAFSQIEMWKELNGEEKRFRPLPLPTFMNFENVQKVLIVFYINHHPRCTFCEREDIPPKDQVFLDDLKRRVDNLKSVFEEGKMYCFMFGKEWEPPTWEYLYVCPAKLWHWRPAYLRSLEEAARIQNVTDKPTEVVIEGATQVDEVPGVTAEEKSIDELFQELFDEPMEIAGQPE